MSNEPFLISTSPIPVVSTTGIGEVKTNSIFKTMNYLVSFLFSRFLLLLFGIFIGIGIVVKFSPETKSLKQQINALKQENDKLKSMLDKGHQNSNFTDIKNSFILKK
jgi:hypothetical protein